MANRFSFSARICFRLSQQKLKKSFLFTPYTIFEFHQKPPILRTNISRLFPPIQQSNLRPSSPVVALRNADPIAPVIIRNVIDRQNSAARIVVEGVAERHATTAGAPVRLEEAQETLRGLGIKGSVGALSICADISIAVMSAGRGKRSSHRFR